MTDDRFASPRSRRMRELRHAVLEGGELWAWGTDDGPLHREDHNGTTMLPLWISESRAREENEPGAEADEFPMRFTLPELQEKVPQWRRAGVRRYGLEPEGESVLYMLDAREFLTFLEHGRPEVRRLP
ncbi:hypothetical protein [Blastococcus sp. SYSU D00820]